MLCTSGVPDQNGISQACYIFEIIPFWSRYLDCIYTYLACIITSIYVCVCMHMFVFVHMYI